MSKLAAHVSELMLFQIELSKSYGMSDWRDDVKNIMLRSGMENRESVFLFSDTQVRQLAKADYSECFEIASTVILNLIDQTRVIPRRLK